MQSGRAVKTIFFDHGRAIFAASNLKKDRLGEALVALGRITDEEFRQAEALLRRATASAASATPWSAGGRAGEERGRAHAWPGR